MTRKMVVIGLAVMTALLVIALLWQFRMAVIYVLISLTLAATLRPLVHRLAGRRFIVRMAWILLYLAILGGFSFLLFLAGKAVISEIQRFAQTVSVQDSWTLPVWLQGSSFQSTVMERLPAPSKLFEALTGSTGQLVLPALLGFSKGIGSLVTALLIILFLSIYWSFNQIHFERLWLSLLPSDQRTRARGIWRTIESNLGAYIRSELIQSLVAGLLLFLGYWLLGSPYPVLLAVIGAIAWLIPFIGAPLAVILPLILGLLTSWQFSLYTALYTLIVLIVLELWVEPHLFRRRWDNPILTLVLLLVMADAFGFLGILLAPPVSAVCQILWNLLVSHRVVSGAAVTISDLKERQTRVWGIINAMDRPPIDTVINSMERLSKLIEKAEPFLNISLPDIPMEPIQSFGQVIVEKGVNDEKGL